MMEFDVVVIGGGIAGGIPAAAYLQKAGARVALIDGRQELGAFIPTHEILPNVMTSPHAGGNWSGSSPAWEDLDLEEYGHRLVVGAVSVGNTNVDGRNLFFSPQRIARFSEKDAARAAKILGGVMSNIVELNELIYYSIPRPDKLETIWNLMASIWGIPAADFSSMNAFELLESTFESPEVRMLFISVPAAQNLGDIATPGQGAFTVVAALGITGGQAIGGNHTLAHAMLRIFLKHGGTILRS